MSAAEFVAEDVIVEASRTKRLKAGTRDAHAGLDQFIMAAEPFASRDNFAKFLKTQYHFHRDLDVLFTRDELDAILPDLQGRRRLHLVEQDLNDLGHSLPSDSLVRFDADTPFDLPEALGWLYVVEGSNLGAAFLLKFAAKLGLNEEFGARHLAGAAEGRGLHWRTFTEALDSIALTDEEELRVIKGAEEAFRAVHAYAVRYLSAD